MRNTREYVAQGSSLEILCATGRRLAGKNESYPLVHPTRTSQGYFLWKDQYFVFFQADRTGLFENAKSLINQETRQKNKHTHASLQFRFRLVDGTFSVLLIGNSLWVTKILRKGTSRYRPWFFRRARSDLVWLTLPQGNEGGEERVGCPNRLLLRILWCKDMV